MCHVSWVLCYYLHRPTPNTWLLNNPTRKSRRCTKWVKVAVSPTFQWTQPSLSQIKTIYRQHSAHIAHSVLLTRHCTLHCTALYCTAPCTLHTACCEFFSVHCTLHTVHCTLHTTHYTLNTKHCTLHTAHYTLHTAHYTVHTAHCKLSSPDLHGVPLPGHSPLPTVVRSQGWEGRTTLPHDWRKWH